MCRAQRASPPRAGWGGGDGWAAVVATATGAFVNAEPVYLQSTGFVLDPDGCIVTDVYSSGAIGRLVPEDVVGLIRYERKHPIPELTRRTPAQTTHPQNGEMA